MNVDRFERNHAAAAGHLRHLVAATRSGAYPPNYPETADYLFQGDEEDLDIGLPAPETKKPGHTLQ